MGVEKEADRLFQAKHVEEIRQKQEVYLKNIDEKKRQLREVVGDSYRDLISSADTIGLIAKQSHDVASAIKLLIQKVESVTEVVVETEPESATENEDMDDLFEAASQVKYIIDSQEAIYGSLDRYEFLDAAVRYLHAMELYKDFSTNSGQYAKQFPFFEHVWPSIRKLDTEIWNRGHAWLGNELKISTRHAASVLACFALLRPMDSDDLLKHLLSARKECILNSLKMNCKDIQKVADGGKEEYSAFEVLSTSLCWICETMGMVIEIFKNDSSHPLFHIINNVEAGLDKISSESSRNLKFLDGRVQDTKKKLQSLSESSVQLEGEDWIKDISVKFGEVLKPLFGEQNTCKELVDLEMKVKHFLEAWTYDFQEADDVRKMTWADVCQQGIGQVIDLWNTTFESNLIYQGKFIIKNHLDNASISANDMVETVVSHARSTACDVPRLGNFIESCSEVGASVRKLKTEDSKNSWWIQFSRGGFQSMDKSLALALDSSVEIMGSSSATSTVSTRDGVFHGFIKGSFETEMMRIESTFQEALDKYEKEHNILIPLALAESDLLSSLVHSSISFRNFIYGPEHYASLTQDDDGVHSYKLNLLHPWARQVITKLEDLRKRCIRTWASWSSQNITIILKDIALVENHSSDTTMLGSRERYTPKYCGNALQSGVTPSAPIHPSAWVVGALVAFCAEIERAGGSQAQEDLIDMVSATHGSEILHAIFGNGKDLLENPSNVKGILQCIYDVRYIGALFGPDQVDFGSIKEHVKTMSSAIDPIDWATYDSDIQQNAEVYAQNAGILLHAATGAADIGNGVISKGKKVENYSMAMADCPSRFAYLPAKLPSRSRSVQSSLSKAFDVKGLGDLSPLTAGNIHEGASSFLSSNMSFSSIISSKAAEVGARLEEYSGAKNILGSLQFPSFTD
eukprot:jgi/Picsp_1/5792/NSC_03151-R1_vps51 vps67 family (components of vesicular transport) protein